MDLKRLLDEFRKEHKIDIEIQAILDKETYEVSNIALCARFHDYTKRFDSAIGNRIWLDADMILKDKYGKHIKLIVYLIHYKYKTDYKGNKNYEGEYIYMFQSYKKNDEDYLKRVKLTYEFDNHGVDHMLVVNHFDCCEGIFRPLQVEDYQNN